MNNMGKYYVYRHIRLDTNEVFYIGIGTKPNTFKTLKQEYNRAYRKDKTSRSSWWHKIKAKSSILVEILYESDNKNTIENKEKEFITLYGRKNLGLGELVNLTNGGTGFCGLKVSPQIKEKRIRNLKPPTGKPMYIYDLEGNFIKRFDSAKEAALNLNVSENSLRNTRHKRSVTKNVENLPYRAYLVFKGIKISPLKPFTKKSKSVIQVNKDGMIINTFFSVKDAANFVGAHYNSIRRVLQGTRKTCKGYFWKYQKRT